MSADWRSVNLVCSLRGGGIALERQPLVPMPVELLALFDRAELAKYMTEDELAALPLVSASVGGDG